MNAILYPTTNLKAAEQGGALRLRRGKGVYVWDEQGRQYIEGLAGLWCTSLGHGNKELIEAASKQLRELSYSHMFGGKSHASARKLAERLAAMVPVAGAHVFFGNSGSDANDTIVKLVKYYFNAIGRPEKKKIIARERAYHGVTVASASLTGLPANHANFDLPIEELGILRAECPHYYRNGRPGEDEEAFASRLAADLDALIEHHGPETVAAFIAEPVNGAGGVVVPPAGYFEKINAVLRKHDVLMIDDEVICGFGRTGAPFGADRFGIEPSIMAFAKGLSAAYVPISAAVFPDFMYEAMLEPSARAGSNGHGFTYSGHPVACAVALKTLEIYERDRIFDRAATAGVYFQQRLHALAGHPLVGEARGVGLIGAVELVADKASRKPFGDGSIGMFCQQRAEEHGLICRALGGNTVALCPPLIVTDEQIDEIFDKLARALDDTLEYVTRIRSA